MHLKLQEAKTPTIRYEVHKWIFVPNTHTEYRYILGTIGNNPLICIGINPSTAEPDKLDPTLQSVERVAQHNGFDSFIIFNVYAQRATSPNDMEPAMTIQICNDEWYILHQHTLCLVTGKK